MLNLSAADNPLNLIDILNSGRQVVVSVLGDQDVVLDTNSANLPVLVQNLEVDVWSVDRVAQVWVDDKLAEVNLSRSVSK